MDNINMIFFEEYKKLDNLFCQMYNDTKGVSSYIEDMENTPVVLCQNIVGWNNTLTYLKRLRHLRNQLAHDISFDVILCTSEDIQWIRNFYDTVLQTNDPIALRTRMEKNKKPQNTNMHGYKRFQNIEMPSQNTNIQGYKRFQNIEMSSQNTNIQGYKRSQNTKISSKNTNNYNDNKQKEPVTKYVVEAVCLIIVLLILSFAAALKIL